MSWHIWYFPIFCDRACHVTFYLIGGHEQVSRHIKSAETAREANDMHIGMPASAI
jgi:hypothetical protein